MSRLVVLIAGVSLALFGLAEHGLRPLSAQAPQPLPLFQPATSCSACHNGLTTPDGEDVSMGTLWRPSMMAHAARDPYWHAGVRREVIDHPLAQAAIENECSRCHMPMAHVTTHLLDRPQQVFANLPLAGNVGADPLAVEGVSCALCHQIAPDQLGTRASFTGGFVVDTRTPLDQRPVYGPYEVTAGHAAVMQSATGFQPAQGTHLQQSEACATCHTLYTHALGTNGKPIGELPEQVPYQEWLESDYSGTTSCQACHMPLVQAPTPIASVLGEPREALSRHDFRGANFFMLGLLNRFRNELGVVALPSELDGAAARTRSFLQQQSATLTVENVAEHNGRLEADVVVGNLAGHKLPTAYPSRRVWLHVVVRDRAGRVVFSSGEPQPAGAIAGNDNDGDAALYEPHYREIRTPDQVQIYEAIMGGADGSVTTGLLTATRYLKDNRVPPAGFDKDMVGDDVKVHGSAAADPDFLGGGDRVRYSIDIKGADGPFSIAAELLYQSIGFRWAQNLKAYDADEPRRFVGYYETLARTSALRLARAETPK
jgi:hypothetical protein